MPSRRRFIQSIVASACLGTASCVSVPRTGGLDDVLRGSVEEPGTEMERLALRNRGPLTLDVRRWQLSYGPLNLDLGAVLSEFGDELPLAPGGELWLVTMDDPSDGLILQAGSAIYRTGVGHDEPVFERSERTTVELSRGGDVLFETRLPHETWEYPGDRVRDPPAGSEHPRVSSRSSR